MSSLGIYFGSKVINVVETQGKKILGNIQINRLPQAAVELEEKVPEEVKMVAILKEELRRNRIQAKEADITLSGKDLIIRNFEMPPLPREELENAINFEVKKYIPYKIEDLISAYQLKFDKASRQNLILFAGIKKETLEKYLSIFRQLDIKPHSLDYSAFSVLKFLPLTGLRYKGIICIICVDLQEENEVNFMVLEDGFPLFSRDITLLGGPEEAAAPSSKETGTGAVLDKIKTEIRVSLDYYKRRFPLKKINKTFFICHPDSTPELEAFSTELDMHAQSIDINKGIPKAAPFSVSFLRAYGSSLSKVVKTDLKINLLAGKAKLRTAREAATSHEEPSLLSGMKVSPLAVIAGLAVCLLVFLFFSLYKLQPLQKEVSAIMVSRPPVSTVSPDLGYEELTTQEKIYNDKIKHINNFLQREIYVTELLDTLPRILPDGMWLENLTFNKLAGGEVVILEGMAYLADNTKELEAVNNFVFTLKTNSVLRKYFKDVVLTSADTREFKGKTMTRFAISCTISKGGL